MDTTTASKALTAPAALLLVGYGLQTSQVILPLLFEQAPPVSLPMFRNIFTQGAFVIVPAAILSTTANAYLAYTQPRQRRSWAVAGALMVAPLVFTQLFMSAGIKRLLDLESNTAAQKAAESTGEVVRLLKAWNSGNWVRIGMYLASATVGLSAMLSRSA